MSRTWAVIALGLLACFILCFIVGCAKPAAKTTSNKPNGFNAADAPRIDWDSESLIQAVNDSRDNEPRRAALSAAILGRRIQLTGFVRFIKVNEDGGGYFIGASDKARFEDCIFASMQSGYFDRNVSINAKVRVDGIVSSITELGMVISGCTLEDYKRPNVIERFKRQKNQENSSVVRS